MKIVMVAVHFIAISSKSFGFRTTTASLSRRILSPPPLLTPCKRPETDTGAITNERMMSSSFSEGMGTNNGSTNAKTNDNVDASQSTKKPVLPKLHSVTVCMVPPPENVKVWETVTAMRKRLKDPGFYRWPPHANLLYPFLKIDDNENLKEIVNNLHNALQQTEPFRVSLDQYGTFGGKQRGVLWLKPCTTVESDESHDNQRCHLQILHSALEEAFPMCKDQTKGGSFTPHMTLSHFENLDDALAGQKTLHDDFGDLKNLDLQFTLDRIYLLERKGDDGQFLRMAEIGLKSPTATSSGIVTRILNPPEPFPSMPLTEEDWVREERMKLKARRSGGRRGGRGRRQQQRNRRRSPRIPDTPEVIAAKRAERKAKRERMEQEAKMEASNEHSD